MEPTFSVEHSFQAQPEAVFDAWTTPELFAIWFGTPAIPIPLDTVVLDAREGGRWAAQMRIPEGPTIDWAGTYTRVARPTLLEFTMTDDPQDEQRGTVPVVVTFVASGGETLMTLTQEAPGFSADQITATQAGYAGFFAAMAELIEAESPEVPA